METKHTSSFLLSTLLSFSILSASVQASTDLEKQSLSDLLTEIRYLETFIARAKKSSNAQERFQFDYETCA